MNNKTRKNLKNCLQFSITVTLLFFLIFQDNKLVAQTKSKADDICGEWWTPNNDGKMTFFRSGGYYYAMVSWLKNPNDPEDGKPKRDKHNPNPALRGRLLQNLILFTDFTYNSGTGKYVDGKVYDAQNSGNKYSCWLKLIERNVLEIHGYVGFSLIGRSEYFTRVQK